MASYFQPLTTMVGVRHIHATRSEIITDDVSQVAAILEMTDDFEVPLEFGVQWCQFTCSYNIAVNWHLFRKKHHPASHASVH